MVGRKSVRNENLELQCEWGNCHNVYSDLGEFYQHLHEHFLQDYNSCSLNVLEEIGDCSLMCKWVECQFISSAPEDMLRHVYFHGYHTKVKWWGLLCCQEEKLSKCYGLQNRNIIPDLPEGFRCEWKDCMLLCDIPDPFYMHVYDHAHFAVAEVHPRKKVFRCHWDGCSYSYEVRAGLKESLGRFKLRDHLKTHTKERIFACPWCGNLYVNKTKFIDHLNRQALTESHCFQCTHCSRTFATERLLKDHMRHHVNHYKCPHCAMTCPNPSAVKHHIKYKHSDERPYTCQYCDYRSKEAYDLQVHMSFHQSALNFKCHFEGCDYGVRSLQNLRQHLRTKHQVGNGKFYCCHMCDRRYGVGFRLTNHLRRIHNFKWPPGHSRFKYKECEDGLFRLQTFRFESIELTEQLMIDQPTNSNDSNDSRVGGDGKMTSSSSSDSHTTRSSSRLKLRKAAAAAAVNSKTSVAVRASALSTRLHNKKFTEAKKSRERIRKKAALRTTLTSSISSSLLTPYCVTSSSSVPTSSASSAIAISTSETSSPPYVTSSPPSATSSVTSSSSMTSSSAIASSAVSSSSALLTSESARVVGELGAGDTIARDDDGKPVAVRLHDCDYYVVKSSSPSDPDAAVHNLIRAELLPDLAQVVSSC